MTHKIGDIFEILGFGDVCQRVLDIVRCDCLKSRYVLVELLEKRDGTKVVSGLNKRVYCSQIDSICRKITEIERIIYGLPKWILAPSP